MPNFICTICGYPNLHEPPRDETGAPSYEICPCCGVEFGYDDETPEVEKDYRKNWIQNGAQWFDPGCQPANWNLQNQLWNIGINLDEFKR